MKSPTSSWTVAAGDVAARVAGRGDPARDLQRDVRPEAVVERARHQPAVEEGNRGRGQHGGIAEAHGRERVVAVVSPDVEMEVSHLDRLLLLAPPHVPFRLDDALNPASAREDLDGCPTSTSAVQPPRPRKKRMPLSSTCVTIRPISSTWPKSANSGASSPAVRTRAIELPIPSTSTSANSAAASRQIAAGSDSKPDGPGACNSRRSTSGAGTRRSVLLDEPVAQPVRWPAMSPARFWGWTWRHERGGSLRLD